MEPETEDSDIENKEPMEGEETSSDEYSESAESPRSRSFHFQLSNMHSNPTSPLSSPGRTPPHGHHSSSSVDIAPKINFSPRKETHLKQLIEEEEDDQDQEDPESEKHSFFGLKRSPRFRRKAVNSSDKEIKEEMKETKVPSPKERPKHAKKSSTGLEEVTPRQLRLRASWVPLPLLPLPISIPLPFIETSGESPQNPIKSARNYEKKEPKSPRHRRNSEESGKGQARKTRTSKERVDSFPTLKQRKRKKEAIKVEGWLVKVNRIWVEKKRKRYVVGDADGLKFYLTSNVNENSRPKEEIDLKSIKRWLPNGGIVPIGYTDHKGWELETQGKIYRFAVEGNEFPKWESFFDSVLTFKKGKREGILLTLNSITNLTGTNLNCYVSIHCGDNKFTTTVKQDAPVWDESFFLEGIELTDEVLFKVYDSAVAKVKSLYETRFAEIKVADLIKRPEVSLYISKSYLNPVVGNGGYPLFLNLTVNGERFPAHWKQPIPRAIPLYDKHLMMFTRGTQGDVQPFVALARGLATLNNWLITIVTELPYKKFIEDYSDVPKGHIQFRPSGGDTLSSIERSLYKWAIQNKSTVMQAAIIARSEVVFFPSEPLFFYWAETMKPDVLVFAFTTATVTRMISEALGIPMIGFIFQPNILPSDKYDAVVPISQIPVIDSALSTHSTQKKLKILMDCDPLHENVSSIRSRRGVKSDTRNTWEVLIEENVPIVIPILEKCFGGKPVGPNGWHDNAVFTNFIFLRRENTVSELSPKLTKFINKCKSKKRPILAIGFSSMPIPRSAILEIVLMIVEKCDPQPAVIAIVGNRESNKVPKATEEKVEEFKRKGFISEEKSVPYSHLFPLMDVIIIHGGLGATAEALRAGVPVIVTGVLLMDQRFWAKRVFEMGIGPEPIHISDFPALCVDVVSRALTNQEWKDKAIALSKEMVGETADGVTENVRQFTDFVQMIENKK